VKSSHKDPPYNVNLQDIVGPFKDFKVNIEEVMIKNFNLNLSTQEFAKLCGRSLSTFKRDFKKHFKTTPSKWLKTRRLEYAKTLLMKSELNVNQICFECGYVNNSHFILTFKNAYQLTPKQFKKTYKKS
jgi:AraC-like DNA-binding protein